MKNLLKKPSRNIRFLYCLTTLLCSVPLHAQTIPEPYNDPTPTQAPQGSGIKIIRVEEAPVPPPPTLGTTTIIPVLPTQESSTLVPSELPAATAPEVNMTPPENGPAVIEVQDNPPPEPPVYNSIELVGLNKVTARSSIIEGALGTVLRFANLEIIAHRCVGTVPGQQEDYKALLEIWELKPNEGPEKIFQGWMFASSPAISALEHPVYDISVKDCKTLDLEE